MDNGIAFGRREEGISGIFAVERNRRMKSWVVLCMLIMILAIVPDARGHTDEDPGAQRGSSGGGHAATFGKPGNPGDVTRSIEVEMNDAMRFRPDRIVVRRDETIRFIVRNTGRLRHEMVLGTREELKGHAEQMRKSPGMKHADPNQVSVPPGKTGELIWRFTRDGTFEFACLEPGHFEAGMIGELVVERKAE